MNWLIGSDRGWLLRCLHRAVQSYWHRPIIALQVAVPFVYPSPSTLLLIFNPFSLHELRRTDTSSIKTASIRGFWPIGPAPCVKWIFSDTTATSYVSKNWKRKKNWTILSVLIKLGFYVPISFQSAGWKWTQFTGSQESIVNMELDHPVISGLRASIRRSIRRSSTIRRSSSIRLPHRNHSTVLSAPNSPPTPSTPSHQPSGSVSQSRVISI